MRNGALLLGLDVVDADHSLLGDPENLQDFAGQRRRRRRPPNAADIMLSEVHEKLLEAVEDEGVSLDSFAVRPAKRSLRRQRRGEQPSGTVNFSFRLVRSMTYTLGGTYFTYLPKARWVNSRTWDALHFQTEDVQTDVDRAWWVILFVEVIAGVVTVGRSIMVVESMVSAAASASAPGSRRPRPECPPADPAHDPALGRHRRAHRAGPVRDRHQRGRVHRDLGATHPVAGGAVRADDRPVDDYKFDGLRYILRPPSAVARTDPALRIQWVLEDRSSGTVLRDEDGPASNRWRFEFTPGSFAAGDFGVGRRGSTGGSASARVGARDDVG